MNESDDCAAGSSTVIEYEDSGVHEGHFAAKINYQLVVAYGPNLMNRIIHDTPETKK